MIKDCFGYKSKNGELNIVKDITRSVIRLKNGCQI